MPSLPRNKSVPNQARGASRLGLQFPNMENMECKFKKNNKWNVPVRYWKESKLLQSAPKSMSLSSVHFTHLPSVCAWPGWGRWELVLHHHGLSPGTGEGRVLYGKDLSQRSASHGSFPGYSNMSRRYLLPTWWRVRGIGELSQPSLKTENKKADSKPPGKTWVVLGKPSVFTEWEWKSVFYVQEHISHAVFNSAIMNSFQNRMKYNSWTCKNSAAPGWG